MRAVISLVLLAVLAACSGCTGESKSFMYDVACQAVKADPGLPADAAILPIEQATIQPLKNAARIDLPYEYRGPDGRTVRESYTVWLKRLAKDWVFDRLNKTPVYPPPAP